MSGPTSTNALTPAQIALHISRNMENAVACRATTSNKSLCLAELWGAQMGEMDALLSVQLYVEDLLAELAAQQEATRRIIANISLQRNQAITECRRLQEQRDAMPGLIGMFISSCKRAALALLPTASEWIRRSA